MTHTDSLARLQDLATLRPGQTRKDTDYLQVPVRLGDIRALLEALAEAERERDKLEYAFAVIEGIQNPPRTK